MPAYIHVPPPEPKPSITEEEKKRRLLREYRDAAMMRLHCKVGDAQQIKEKQLALRRIASCVLKTLGREEADREMMRISIECFKEINRGSNPRTQLRQDDCGCDHRLVQERSPAESADDYGEAPGG